LKEKGLFCPPARGFPWRILRRRGCLWTPCPTLPLLWTKRHTDYAHELFGCAISTAVKFTARRRGDRPSDWSSRGRGFKTQLLRCRVFARRSHVQCGATRGDREICI